MTSGEPSEVGHLEHLLDEKKRYAAAYIFILFQKMVKVFNFKELVKGHERYLVLRKKIL